ncbi:hypothetical protein CEP54_014577 [Fusarium duplospermum]|uniref:protein-ribulosamine 3-kinase n=1 Tax=Fusarium duplospermum TaxID=1325734 RepID=A0A428NVD6_9HYPO|nr:hypothetical protein CEP54_014577 [Fusarium duplospermum]
MAEATGTPQPVSTSTFRARNSPIFSKQRREGPNAGPMFRGEYESMKLINKMIPDFTPIPIAWGKLNDSDGYFILFSFHNLRKDEPSDKIPDKPPIRPPIPLFTHAVAQLHTLSIDANPTGKFGFHMPTYNGTLEQDNTWTDTWEEFYARGMRHMLKLEEEARGPSEELQQLSGPFFDKVIPRLLRPLETDGRSIKPVLLHGDLWLGNVSNQTESGNPLMFDASAFWGHNEYELATLRLVGDDDDSVNRVIIHDSALYPEEPQFRETLIEEIKKLVEKFS